MKGPLFHAGAVAAAIVMSGIVMPAPLTAQSGDRELLGYYDKDKDGRLNAVERQAAFESLRFNVSGRGGGRNNWGPSDVGVTIAPGDVAPLPASTGLYDPDALRTVFIEFEDADWEAKMVAFYRTDIDIPAKVIVDGRTYPDVGVHFRGNSSFSSVPNGYKRSMMLTFDDVNEDQKLLGYSKLKLLNSNTDPTFMRGILTMEVAREYYMSPKANFVRVVINGENWGLYLNIEHLNDDMTQAWYGKGRDARWKAPGSSGGRVALNYYGDNIAYYRSAYEIKSRDDPAQWEALVAMIRTLNTTPPDRLEAALQGVLNVDGALKFLALDNIFVSSDGYWAKEGDYAIYRDPKGVFHVLQHDINEFFLASGGRGGSIYLDPLNNEGDPSKALAQRLLAVPALKERYLGYVQEISRKWLDWKVLGPKVQRYNSLIRTEVFRDTKKLFFNEDYIAGISDGGGAWSPMPLRSFVDQRRAFLDSYFATPTK